MNFEKYLQDYVMKLAPLINQQNNVDFFAFQTLRDRVHEDIRNRFLFYPIDRKYVDTRCLVSFVDKPAFKFYIFFDFTLLSIYDMYDSIDHTPNIVGGKLVVYARTSGRNYRLITSQKRFKCSVMNVLSKNYINGKRPLEKMVFEIPVGIDFFFFFSPDMTGLSIYLGLHMAHVEKYTSKKDISSILSDYNSRFFLQMGYRYNNGYLTDNYGTNINSHPFTDDGGGIVKNNDPIYLAPFSGTTNSFLSEMDSDLRSRFDYFKTNMSTNLFSCHLRDGYHFENRGEYSLDDYDKYQEESFSFARQNLAPGDIWNGYDLFTRMNGYVFSGCSHCYMRNEDYYNDCQSFACQRADEMIRVGSSLSNDIYELDGIFFRADSRDDIYSTLLWYVLLCPHESSVNYGLSIHRLFGKKTVYRNFFNFKNEVTLSARVEMTLYGDAKKKYYGNSTMSKQAFTMLSRMPSFYDLIKDFAYRTSYEELIKAKEREYQGTFTGYVHRGKPLIPGIDYKIYNMKKVVEMYVSSYDVRHKFVSLFRSQYSDIVGSRVSVVKQKFVNTDSSIIDSLIDMVKSGCFQTLMCNEHFHKLEVSLFVDTVSSYKFCMDIVTKICSMYALLRMFITSIVSHIVTYIGLVNKTFDFATLVLSKDCFFSEGEDVSRLKSCASIQVRTSKRTGVFCVPSYSRVLKLVQDC